MKAAAAAFAARICLSRTLADWRVNATNLREQADDSMRTAQHHFFKQAAGLFCCLLACCVASKLVNICFVRLQLVMIISRVSLRIIRHVTAVSYC